MRIFPEILWVLGLSALVIPLILILNGGEGEESLIQFGIALFASAASLKYIQTKK